MKQLKIILLASIFILTLAGCGTKEKLKEKLDENEQIVIDEIIDEKAEEEEKTISGQEKEENE